MSAIVGEKNAITLKHQAEKIELCNRTQKSQRNFLRANWGTDEKGRLVCRWIAESS
ncbi:MAG: hypothetical protein DSM107014_11565 [Gomphosphaeria aponina SAG 52.96 = DSM 107014]|uniref:Uncharacterized protein n=1 Tax=Gomphosphaeria aponina SAG 52.96 = DSM 107014 TaxID=1521640 RepID=A0A941GRJ2_9CHRO|nr:hypothetical protein [Gomphosphaeria aponina SAG 52.96 = DSM 107014]